MIKEFEFKRKGGRIQVIEEFYNSLSRNRKKDIDDFLKYRISRGVNSDKINDIKRTVVQLMYIYEKELSKITRKELIELASIIKTSKYSDYQKNEILTNLKSYLKYGVKNWSEKFNNLEDIRVIRKPVRKRNITKDDLFTKKDIEKLVKHETKMYWKAFLLTQFEGGLRTKETRFLKWKDINFNVDKDISEINIYSTKTKEQRTVYIKEATFYLQKLKEEQINRGKESEYVFPAKDLKKPINQGSVSMWMSRLSERALGRHSWNYLLRHSRGNQLYKLSKEGKISKDTAIKFMGHSEKMSEVYTHLSSDEIKQMMKQQIYHFEDLPPEKRNEFEQQIQKQNKAIFLMLNLMKDKVKGADKKKIVDAIRIMRES